MNAFQSIAESKNTSLAVVAPGIAEALFATALGLLAAIPAVAAYNAFANNLEKISARLDSFSTEFSTLLARQLDEEASNGYELKWRVVAVGDAVAVIGKWGR